MYRIFRRILIDSVTLHMSLESLIIASEITYSTVRIVLEVLSCLVQWVFIEMSSHISIWNSFNIAAIPNVFPVIQIRAAAKMKSNVSLKADCAVRPWRSRVAVLPARLVQVHHVKLTMRKQMCFVTIIIQRNRGRVSELYIRVYMVHNQFLAHTIT